MGMKAYKGFDENLKCRGFQYEIGKEYETDKAELCESGFHACEYPLDVFNYYNPSNSRFAEVELEETTTRESSDSEDSKVCGKKIKIGAEIGIKGLIEAAVKFTLEKVDWGNAKESNTGDQSAATNTGDRSAATNTGDQSAATNTGYRSAATNTGDRSAATNTGDQSAATNTGDQSAATNTGYRSAATNTGDQSAATVEGKESVAISIGVGGRAKGEVGCFLVLAEWEEIDDVWHRKSVKSRKVDGKSIKANTYYTLNGGKFVEAEESEQN
jgi:hypothetical protein